MDNNNERLEKYIALMERLRKGEEILSFSSFSTFCDCPLHFVDYKLKDRVETPAMFAGTVKHAAILEPDKFDEEFVVEPKVKPVSAQQKGYCECRGNGMSREDAFIANYSVKTSITDKQYEKMAQMDSEYADYIKFCQEKGERQVVSHDLYTEAMRIKDRVYRNESARWLLDQMTETEKVVEWKYMGLKWKGYIDGTGENVRTDLKFLRSTQPRKLKWEIAEKRYHWQVGNLYGIPDKRADGGAKDAYILAVSPEGYCTVMEINKTVIDAQWEEIERMIGMFKKCIFKGEFGQSYDFWPRDGIYKMSMI